MSKGKALLNLFGNLAQAATTGLKAVKPVDEGCGKCPDGQKQGPAVRRRTVRTRRSARR
jgi:hypothetical protein